MSRHSLHHPTLEISEKQHTINIISAFMLYCNTYRRFLMAMVIINRKPKAKTVNSTAKTTMRRSGIKKNNYSMNFTVHRNFHFLTNILESN